MKNGLNKTMLIGTVGKDSQVRVVGQGDKQTKVANFTIAVNESFRKADGEQVQKTTWYKVDAWRGLASVCENYVKKGTNLYVEGKLESDEYDATDGTKVRGYKLVAQNLTLLPSAGNSNNGDNVSGEQQQVNYGQPSNPQQNAPQQYNQQPQGSPVEQARQGVQSYTNNQGGQQQAPQYNQQPQGGQQPPMQQGGYPNQQAPAQQYNQAPQQGNPPAQQGGGYPNQQAPTQQYNQQPPMQQGGQAPPQQQAPQNNQPPQQDTTEWVPSDSDLNELPF